MTYIHAIEGLVAFLALILFLLGPWQWCMTDLAREQIFTLRGRLFDIARSGELEFSCPSYRKLRALMNSQIRFAHHLSLWRFLALSVVAFKAARQRNPLEDILSGIENDLTKQKIRGLFFEMHTTVFFVLFLKSPLTSLALLAVLLCACVVAIPVAVCVCVVAGAHVKSSEVWCWLSKLRKEAGGKAAQLLHKEASLYP